jgi:hypothetical protein
MEASTMTRLRRLRDQLDRSEARTEAIRSELHTAILEAHGRGESVALLAEVTRFTRARIYQLLERKGKP